MFNQSLAVKYNTATNGGKTRWNAQALKVTFSTASSASAADVLVVAGAPSSVTYWAVTEGTCSGGKYTSRVTIRWHTLNTSGLGATPLRMIATHEFGHVLGLGHVTRACTIASSARAVMVQGDFKWSCDWGTEPWADDVNGVKALYT